MDHEAEAVIIRALTLRAQGGDRDAARILFNEKSKRIRPVHFDQCQTLDELKDEFESYMAMDDITRAESEHAAKSFDRLFKLILARDENRRKAEVEAFKASGILLVPMADPHTWEQMAEPSQRRLKDMVRA